MNKTRHKKTMLANGKTFQRAVDGNKTNSSDLMTALVVPPKNKKRN
jgi:hypothetical protein